MGLMFVIFLYGSIFDNENRDLLFRRSASFVVFMSIFAFMFVKIDSEMLQSFKLAVIIWSLGEALMTIFTFISIDGNNQGFYAKGILGSQRIGFIYMMGLWTLVSFKTQIKILKIIKFIALYVILVGIFITYSRSSIAGLVISSGLYFGYQLVYLVKSNASIKKALQKYFIKICYFVLMLFLVYIFFHGAVNFYTKTIFRLVLSTQSEILNDESLSLYTSATLKTNEIQQIQNEIQKLKSPNQEILQSDLIKLSELEKKAQELESSYHKDLEIEFKKNEIQQIQNEIQKLKSSNQEILQSDLIKLPGSDNSSQELERINQ
jgi:hypothetical protein